MGYPGQALPQPAMSATRIMPLVSIRAGAEDEFTSGVTGMDDAMEIEESGESEFTPHAKPRGCSNSVLIPVRAAEETSLVSEKKAVSTGPSKVHASKSETPVLSSETSSDGVVVGTMSSTSVQKETSPVLSPGAVVMSEEGDSNDMNLTSLDPSPDIPVCDPSLQESSDVADPSETPSTG